MPVHSKIPSKPPFEHGGVQFPAFWIFSVSSDSSPCPPRHEALLLDWNRIHFHPPDGSRRQSAIENIEAKQSKSPIPSKNDLQGITSKNGTGEWKGIERKEGRIHLCAAHGLILSKENEEEEEEKKKEKTEGSIENSIDDELILGKLEYES